MKKSIIVIKVIFLFFLVSCEKEKEVEDVLPAITTSGANAFGYMIDDRVFAVKEKCDYRMGIPLYTPPCASVDISNYGNFYFRLQAESERFIKGQVVEIYIAAELNSTKTQVLKLSNSSISFDNDYVSEYFELDTLQTNELKILNSNSKYISGVFNLHLINESGRKKVLNEGRFDIEF